jgi:hypothetical protein
MASIKEMIDLANFQAGPGRLTTTHEGGSGAVGAIMSVLKGQKLQQDETIKKQQDQMKHRADMYKTLREAGYDPKSAYESVMKNQLAGPGGEDAALIKDPKEKILAKIARGESLTTGEQDIYDNVIKKKAVDSGGNMLDQAIADNKAASTEKTKQTTTQLEMQNKILEKVSSGKTLTVGEQKIYDDVIKKVNNNSGSDLSGMIDTSRGSGQMVKVIAPDGTKGSIPQSKLAAALKAGYKKR